MNRRRGQTSSEGFLLPTFKNIYFSVNQLYYCHLRVFFLAMSLFLWKKNACDELLLRSATPPIERTRVSFHPTQADADACLDTYMINICILGAATNAVFMNCTPSGEPGLASGASETRCNGVILYLSALTGALLFSLFSRVTSSQPNTAYLNIYLDR